MQRLCAVGNNHTLHTSNNDTLDLQRREARTGRSTTRIQLEQRACLEEPLVPDLKDSRKH